MYPWFGWLKITRAYFFNFPSKAIYDKIVDTAYHIKIS